MTEIFDLTKQVEMNKYIGQRIHYTQMTDVQLKGLMKRLVSVDKWKVTGHAFDRIIEKGINATENDIKSVLDNCEILEYKIDYNGKHNRCRERVVVRAKAVVNRFYNLNLVYDINTNTIVTVWINHVDDRHDTLKWEIYNKDMKVFL